MSRIINRPAVTVARPPQAWRRLLLGGVAVSVLLHGVALDFWRGRLAREGPPGLNLQAPPLQGRLQPSSAEVVPEERLQKPFSSMPLERLAAPPSVARPQQEQAAPAAAPQALPAAEAALRPLTVAEGLVAYRLELLSSLRAPAGLSAPVRLTLVHAGDTVDAQVLIHPAGLAEAGPWAAAVQQAAMRTPVPGVLAGRRIELELEFEP